MSDLTPEIQNMVMSFVGQTYAETQQLDQNIVGTSVNLTRQGDRLKQSAGKIFNDLKSQAVPQPVQPGLVPQQQQLALFPQNSAQPQVQAPKDPNQMEFAFEVIKAQDVYDELREIKKELRGMLGLIEELKNKLESPVKKKKIL